MSDSDRISARPTNPASRAGPEPPSRAAAADDSSCAEPTRSPGMLSSASGSTCPRTPGADAIDSRPPVAPRASEDLDLSIDEIEPTTNLKEGFTGQER